jgi:hypothetical protein
VFPVRKQRKQAEPENQPASIYRVGSVRRTIIKKTVRKRVPKTRSQFAQKHVLDVRNDGFREYLI